MIVNIEIMKLVDDRVHENIKRNGEDYVKKAAGLVLIGALSLGLAACGSSEEGEGAGANKSFEAKIDGAQYILVSEQDGGVSGDEALLAVELEVKNTSKDAISLSSNDVSLYDGDEQLEPNTDVYSDEIETSMRSGKIASDKSKKLTYLFNVEKDKEYEIGLQPISEDYDNKIEEVKLKLDTAKYEKSLKNLETPEKALTAYIDVLFLGKENEDFDKYVVADKEEVEKSANKAFRESINKVFSNDLTEEGASNLYKMYKDELNSKATFKAKTIENVNGKAVVEVNYSGIGVYNLYNTVSDYKRAYYQETNEYDSKKQEAYAISKFKDILGGAELKESNYPLEIEMVEKDGKWEIKPKDKYSDTVEKAFAAGDIN